MASEQEAFEHWAILELMGHRRLAGFVRTVELAGASMIRLDVPAPAEANESTEWEATQFYNPSAVYCLTPTTEETARRVAALSRPAPVQRWELPAAALTTEKDDEPWEEDDGE